MNGAMYFVEMDQEGGKGLGANRAGAKYGTGYCDAQCPHDMKWISGEANSVEWVSNPNDPFGNMGVGKYGSCCAEMDIWEATHSTTLASPEMYFMSCGHWASQYPVPYLAPALLAPNPLPPSWSISTKYIAPFIPQKAFETSKVIANSRFFK